MDSSSQLQPLTSQQNLFHFRHIFSDPHPLCVLSLPLGIKQLQHHSNIHPFIILICLHFISSPLASVSLDWEQHPSHLNFILCGTHYLHELSPSLGFDQFVFDFVSTSLSLAGNLGRLNWVRHRSWKSSATQSYKCVLYFRAANGIVASVWDF